MSDITPVIGSSLDWRSIDGKRGDVVRGELVLTGDLDVDLPALSGWTVVGVERVPEPPDGAVVSGDLAEFREWLTRLEANHRRWADTAVAFTRGISGNPHDAGLRFYKALPALLAEVETLRKATPLVPEVPRGRAVNASTSYDATDGAAPEVPPRRDGLREAVEAQITGLLSISEPLSPIERGNLGAYQDVLNLIDRLAATRTPEGDSPKAAEPPDSGDGAAYQRKWGRRWNDGLWPVDESRDAGIDADALAIAIRRTRTTSRLYRQDRLAAPLIAEYLAWRDPRNVLRSGSPAPEGGE